MEKSNNTGLIVIIGILIAVICLSVGFVVGKGMLPKEETKTTEKEENNNNQVDNNNSAGNNSDNNPSTDSDIIILSKDEYQVEVQRAGDLIEAYNEFFGTKYTSTGINASNDELLLFLARKLNKSSFTVNELKEQANNYYADSIQINYTDIKLPGSNEVLYKLDSNNKYTAQSVGTDGPSTVYMHSFLETKKYDKTNDIYILEMKNIYNTICGGTCGKGYGSFYSDPGLKKVVYTNDGEGAMHFSSVYDKVADKLPITVYKFKKNSSGNYVLIGVEYK